MKTFSFAILVIALFVVGCKSEPTPNLTPVQVEKASLSTRVFAPQPKPSDRLIIPEKMFVSDFDFNIGMAKNEYLEEYPKGETYRFAFARYVIKITANGKEYEIQVDGFDHTQDMDEAEVFPDKIAAMGKIYDQVVEKSPGSFVLVLDENGHPFALDMEGTQQENEDGKVGKLILTQNVWNSLSDCF